MNLSLFAFSETRNIALGYVAAEQTKFANGHWTERLKGAREAADR